jgi:hypothetical protein
MLDGHTWPDAHTWRLSQREIREGKAPRRLAERCDSHPPRHSRRWSGAAHLARRVALAVSVVFLVIASTVVHSDDYTHSGRGVTLSSHLNLRAQYERIDVTNASGSDAFWLSPSWRF